MLLTVCSPRQSNSGGSLNQGWPQLLNQHRVLTHAQTVVNFGLPLAPSHDLSKTLAREFNLPFPIITYRNLPSPIEDHGWTVSNDNSRILVLVDLQAVSQSDEMAMDPKHFKVKFNWFSELNKLVPVE